jgi:NAD(P)-dependent dehydrogenase (short-subunit alcohol dehydrogenase family)
MSTILLTGANGNLGLTVTERMLKDGHRVLAVEGRQGAGELIDRQMLETHQVDLLDENGTGEFVRSIIARHPDLRAAVLLVGGFAMGRLPETSPEELEKMIKLNFYSAYHVVRHLLPHFLQNKKGGQFILIGSRPGLNVAEGKNMFAYTLGKSMVFRLAEFINAEGKDREVTATVIVPATIATDANKSAMPDADFSKWVPPANIADAISFSLSETGRMLRETIIRIYNRS